MQRGLLVCGIVLCFIPLASLGQDPEFFCSRTVATVNQPLTLPLRLDEAAAQDQEWILKANPPQNIKLLYPPKVLVGNDVAYTRILPLQSGEVRLQLPNRQTLILDVRENITPHRMEWITPAEQSALSGQVDVAVEWKFPDTRKDSWNKHLPVLKIGDRPGIEPTAVLTDTLPAYVRLVYSLNASDLPTGWQAIQILDPNKTATPLLTREVLFLDQIPESDVQTLEAESLREELVERNRDKMRPLPKIEEVDSASGGKAAHLFSGGQALATKIISEHGGFYQFYATTRGSLAANALPSIGLFIEHENNDTATATRTFSTDWQRVAVGHPVYLKPGETICSLRFLNDFSQKKEDRNCLIDKITFVRVPDAAGPRNEKESSLLVAFDNIFDGLTVRGPTPVRARTFFNGIENLKEEPPQISLILNGRSVRTAHLARADFLLQPDELKSGANTLQLEARLGSRQVRSSPQTLHLAEKVAVGPSSEHREFIFGPRDPSWSDATLEYRSHYKGKKHLPMLALNSQSSISLNLPDHLKGRFRVFMEAGGDSFEGDPRASVRLTSGNETRPLSDLEVSSNRSEHETGIIELKDGQASAIEIAFTNDHYNEKKGDRNLHVYQLRLIPFREEQDTSHPVVQVHYPKPGHTVWREDAIVADAFDRSGLKAVQLLINGQPHGPAYRPSAEPGRLVLPLVATPLTPGMNRFALLVRDRKGNETTTDEVPFLVASAPPKEPGHYHSALHLLNRLAYGPEPQHLARILTEGKEAWLKEQLKTGEWSPGENAARERALLTNHQENDYWIPRRALAESILTDHPVRARFHHWVQNHFSTWIQKAGYAEKWAEHQAFSRAGFAPFDQLLNLSATSPAMLVYLDQHSSFAGSINENYAREIMELHTLSVNGRYEQDDVTRLAHLFTGWMAVEEAPSNGEGGREKPHRFRFAAGLNESNAQRVIGLDLPKADSGEAAYDRIRFVLETLSRHPDTARFICEKLANHYAAYPAPLELVDALEDTYHRTGGDLRKIMITLAHHPGFLKSADEHRLANPMDYSIRIARMLKQADSGNYSKFLERSGMGLFGKSTPDGYPEEPQAYADSNAMLQRWHLARELAWTLYHQMNRSWDLEGDSVAKARNLAQLTTLSLNGTILEKPSRDAVASLLEKIPEEKLWLPAVCALILQLPETQNR